MDFIFYIWFFKIFANFLKSDLHVSLFKRGIMLQSMLAEHASKFDLRGKSGFWMDFIFYIWFYKIFANLFKSDLHVSLFKRGIMLQSMLTEHASKFMRCLI